MPKTCQVVVRLHIKAVARECYASDQREPQIKAVVDEVANRSLSVLLEKGDRLELDYSS